jgi:hypothetical protein
MTFSFRGFVVRRRHPFSMCRAADLEPLDRPPLIVYK